MKPVMIFFVVASSLIVNQVVNEQPCFTVEDKYNGGRAAFYNDFNSQLKYPPKLKSEQIFGIVYFELIIDTLGNVSNVEIIKGVHPLFEKEIKSKIRLTNGNWTPEIVNGEKNNYKVSEHVYFELR